MLSLFLGAGFSKWAFDLPLVNQLFDFQITTTSIQEEKKLALIEQDWIIWLKGNPNETPEKFVYWCINKSSHRKSRIVWYVNRRLTEPFMTKIQGSYSAAMFDERSIRENLRIIEIRAFLNNLLKHGLNGIITCNYDTIIECTLGTAGFNYGIYGEVLHGRGKNPTFPWQNAHVGVTGVLPLSKLHGSLSWDADKKYTSGKPGRIGKALIIPPAPEKTAPSELENMWELGSKILSNSKILIFFGFAFNPYDEALLDFIKSNTKHINQIVLIDPYPAIDKINKLMNNKKILTINPLKYNDMSNINWSELFTV